MRDDTYIEQPLRVETPGELAWTDQADVVVVGFGGAGAAAAIEARQNGAEVIAIDRFQGGGTTALSGGIVYAGNTAFQRDAGFDDTAVEMYKYLSLEVGGAVSPETLKRFCEGSAADVDWLQQQGVQFRGSFYPGKTSYPPPDKYLYFSGNEAIAGYKEKAVPAPRGHRTLGKGWTGYVFFDALKTAALRAGVRLRRHCRAQRLVVDAEGAVLGVEVLELPDDKALIQQHDALYAKVTPLKPFDADAAEAAIREARALEDRHGARRLIRATGGVVLATGGFVNNLKMLEKHGPLYGRNYRSLMRMGSMGCDGSGIALGESAGGTSDFMGSLFVANALAPPHALLKGILVNTGGQRFINEESYAGFVGRAIGTQPDGAARLILDGRTFRRAVWQALTAGRNAFVYYSIPVLLNMLFGGTRRGRTLEALAAKCGIDGAGLAATVAQYNADQAQGRPDAFGKSEVNKQPIRGGSYWGLNLSVTNRFGFTMVLTLGGLRVNETSGQVLRQDGTSIEGLYAVGRAAVGLCSHGYFSGMGLADGVFSGRRAGRHGARRAREIT